MNYAIVENGIVVNIICLHPMNAEDFPNAVPLDGLPAGIGDTYADGIFYRNGLPVADEMADMRETLNHLGVYIDG